MQIQLCVNFCTFFLFAGYILEVSIFSKKPMTKWKANGAIISDNQLSEPVLQTRGAGDKKSRPRETEQNLNSIFLKWVMSFVQFIELH